jgi:phosphoribosylglycinamide formyltransferase 1
MRSMPPLALGVLISGRGSNLQAILDAIAEGRLNARVRLVLSNRADAPGLARAQRAGVPTCVIPHTYFTDRSSFDRALVLALREAGVDWVVLAGFMRLLTPVFLDAFQRRVVNVHPSLLPAFPGIDAQAQALAYGVKITGCTVHLVDRGMDTGPIIAQAPVPVLDDDTPDTLAARILVEEHATLVRVLGWIADRRLDVVVPEGESITATGNEVAARVRVRVRDVPSAEDAQDAKDAEDAQDPKDDEVARGRGG